MQPDRDDTTDDAPVAAPGVVAGGGADALPTRIEDLYAMLCNMEDQRQEEELALCAAQKEHECLGRRLAETQAEHQAHASTLKLLQQRCEEEQPLTDSACAECVVAESALPGMQHQLQQAEDALLQLCDTELSACSAMFAATSAADCHPSEVREAKATLHSLSMKLQRAVELLPRESETPTTTVMEETQNNTPRVLSEEGAADVPARPFTHKRVTFAEDLVEVILIPPCGSFLRTPTSRSVPRLPMAFRGGMPSRSALRKPREDALEEANSNFLCEEAAGPTSNAAHAAPAGAPPRTLLRVPIGLKRSHETPSVEHAHHVAAGDVHSGDATENEDAAGVAIHSGDAAELTHMVRYPLQLQRGTAIRTMNQRRKMRTTWRFSSADN